MHFIRKTLYVLFLLVSISIEVEAQNGFESRQLLDSLSRSSVPELKQEVDLSFNNIPMQELIRTLCNISGINITIDRKIDYPVNANFNKVTVKDVLNFLIEKNHLSVTNYGKIIQIQPYEAKEEHLEITTVHDSLINYNVHKIRAGVFFKELTGVTGNNFILSPGIDDYLINGYGHEISRGDAFLQLAVANKLKIEKISPVLYTVSPSPSPAETIQAGTEAGKKRKKTELKYDNGQVSADIKNAGYTDILEDLSGKAGYTIQLLTPIEKETSINIPYSPVEDFLCLLFSGSEYTYKLDNNVLWVGPRKSKEIKSFELIKLNNRRVDSLLAVLPNEIKQELVIKEFQEQNSVLVWGDADQIVYFRKSLQKVDVVVPVILIDVIIVDAEKNFDIETGIEAGLGTEATETKGTINAGLDYTMGAGSVNKLLGTIGLTRLGKVTPNFYMKLKALETDGVIDIRSTPQLATLNGHSATMSIGQTEYYKEASSNYWGTQSTSTGVETQYEYKPVEAKLGITIKPVVAGNGQVTLSINVEQSTFLDRIEETAPPGLESKKFNSIIRVNNQEMILLGGLEEISNSSSRSGWPFLSKIPVLNWIFASRKESKSKSHLNIFIKPTVIY